MTQALFLAQVCLAADSSVPADVAMNTYHFALDTDPAGAVPSLSFEQIITGERPAAVDENGIQGDLSDVYEDISLYLSSNIDPAASRIKWFNLSDPSPRVALLDLPMVSFVNQGPSAFPPEVALTVSFQAAPLSGISQASRRNRVFIGPLATVSGDGKASASSLTVFKDAFSNFASNSAAADHWSWRVYSPTTGLDSPVDNGWIDNAYDTQRRRGVESTIRETWTNNSV